MSYNSFSYDQDQRLLLAPSIPIWVPDGCLTRFASELIDQLHENGCFSIFYQYQRLREDDRACKAYHSRMIIKALVYTYYFGIDGIRRITRTQKNDVALRHLSASSKPDPSTITTLRQPHFIVVKSGCVGLNWRITGSRNARPKRARPRWIGLLGGKFRRDPKLKCVAESLRLRMKGSTVKPR